MRDPAYTDRVREDFDRLAVLSEGSVWDHNSHYHPFLLRQLPERLGEALEVGYGTGEFARLLAERSETVLAVDLSPRMIEAARVRSMDHPNVEYLVVDASSWEFPSERFDCAASVATLHHLPLAPTLARMGGALRSGRTLLVLDLFRARLGRQSRGRCRFPGGQGHKVGEDRRPARPSADRAAAGVGGARLDRPLPDPRRGAPGLRRGEVDGGEGEEAPPLSLHGRLAQAAT
jgi:SAM-dependent methyltransferase